MVSRMPTDRARKLVTWMKTRTVATMKALRHQFQVSHMTVFRILSESGYHSSYNRNGAYYTLRDTPQFDSDGLWNYRGIRFSIHGTLKDTIVALIENSDTGQTVLELEERLHTKSANLLSRLVHDTRLTQRALQGRLVVYLASDSQQADKQYRRRQERLQQATVPQRSVPEGCSPTEVIEILRSLVLAPAERPDQLARQLTARVLHITASQVSRVIEHYALKKKRHR
ncbi:hypothetical protein BH10PLA2_BH10PLA2_16550 [soil metagenome]